MSWYIIPEHINNFGAETAEPEVKVLDLTILSPGQPDLVLPIPFQADEKGYAFALKDGSPYSFRFSFIVSNNIVSGLKYTNTVWKTGVRGEDTKNASCILAQNSSWSDLLLCVDTLFDEFNNQHIQIT